MEQFQKMLGYKFKDLKLIKTALTHSSYAHENRDTYNLFNEKLEFLGDAVLELVISDCIFKEFPELTEGELTKLRASIVCEGSLCLKAKELSIGKYLKLGKGEDLGGGRNRPSVLADAFEAILGAIYLDSNIETVKNFIIQNMKAIIEEKRNTFKNSDYKTFLQEYIQSKDKSPLVYKIIEELGPAHDKVFKVEVIHNDVILGIGEGRSKKDAEQNSALNALKQLKLL